MTRAVVVETRSQGGPDVVWVELTRLRPGDDRGSLATTELVRR